MYKTQLVTTKGEVIRTFISASKPASQAYSTMGGVNSVTFIILLVSEDQDHYPSLG